MCIPDGEFDYSCPGLGARTTTTTVRLEGDWIIAVLD